MQPGLNTSGTSDDVWSEAITRSQKRPRTKLKKSEIVHFPEFEHASRGLDDPYWVTVFQQCSRKKFPRGFVYSDGHLKHRANNITIALPDDVQGFAATAKYFFQENGKLYSEKDQENRKRQHEQEIIAKINEDLLDWSKVSRSKNRRSAHIRDYINSEYGECSRNIRDELFTQINVCFECGALSKENIKFVDGKIVDIEGVGIDESGSIQKPDYIKPKQTPSRKTTNNKDKKYRHYETWCKYLEEYKKHLVSSARSSHTHQTAKYSEEGGSGQLSVYTS